MVFKLLAPSLALAVNDYTLTTTGKICPDDARIPLPCGFCGPNWGDLKDCEEQCNALDACTDITFFQDNGCRVYSSCSLMAGSGTTKVPDVGTDVYHRNNASKVTRPDGPCDIFDAAGKPCVAAHSVVRSLYANYTGSLYRITRDSDHAGLDIGTHLNGFARVADHDSFCAGTSCYTERIFDQTPRGNHLDTSPAGGACNFPLAPVNSSKEQISIGGNTVYGAYFEGHMGYRNDKTSGVATGETEQTMYMVTRGDHVNSGCCFGQFELCIATLSYPNCNTYFLLVFVFWCIVFAPIDYGNAETDNNDDGKGTMEAIYFGTSKVWGHGEGNGPWVMADLENGLWAGDQRSAPAPSINFKYVTAFAKGKKGGFALKGGDAASGKLQTLHDGARPAGYETMNKQGAIILGIGGDNSCSAVGTFYEGAMTASFTDDATDDAVQASIVAAGYGR
jgi:hypothetical protein